MLTKEDREIDDFLRGSSQWMRIEVNFIIDKFSKLTVEKQREIHKQLKSRDEKQFILAAKKLIKFIRDNPVEVSKTITTDAWFPPWTISSSELKLKTRYVGLYFKMYLREQVVIEKIT